MSDCKRPHTIECVTWWEQAYYSENRKIDALRARVEELENQRNDSDELYEKYKSKWVAADARARALAAQLEIAQDVINRMVKKYCSDGCDEGHDLGCLDMKDIARDAVFNSPEKVAALLALAEAREKVVEAAAKWRALTDLGSTEARLIFNELDSAVLSFAALDAALKKLAEAA